MHNKKFKNIYRLTLFILSIILIYLLFAIPSMAQKIFNDIEIFNDIPYTKIKDTNPILTSLDIYAPAMGNNLPVIIFIHGETWVFGDKGNVDYKALSFAKNNFLYISINYRLSPDIKHPIHAQDTAKAISWVYENISDYRGNPENIFLLGHSAGGHLAALIGLDEQYLGNLGFSNKIIRGIIGLDSAAYHLPTLFKSEPENYYLFEMAFGNDSNEWEKASPIYYIEKEKVSPPFLLIYAGDREVSKIINLTFAKKLEMANQEIDLYYAPNKTHTSIERELGKPEDNTIGKIFEFIYKHKNDK